MADEDIVENTEETEKKPAGIKRLLPILILALVFLGVQVGIGVMIVNKLQPEDPKLKALEEEKRLEEEARRKATEMGVTMDKPIEVTVNVAETDGSRFVICAVQFEWDAVTYPTLGAELEARQAKIKDIIINILATKPLTELHSRDGKKNLTNAILSDLNMIIPEEVGEVRSCFLDKFIIQ
jgi:flagellar FliL protein